MRSVLDTAIEEGSALGSGALRGETTTDGVGGLAATSACVSCGATNPDAASEMLGSASIADTAPT